MKIEKISENQIRCTLTKKDLADRHIGLKDLAYGAPRTRELFQEMMEQAFLQYGFDAEDIPVMIEATPLSHESVVLLITKVENPDELDTRFSRFTASDGPQPLPEDMPGPSTADEVLSAFDRLHEILRNGIENAASPKQRPDLAPPDLPFDKPESPEEEAREREMLIHEAENALTHIYAFRTLEDVIRMSRVLHGFYHGENSLYKDEKAGRYYLIAEKSSHTPEEFNKFCNMITEYGESVPSATAARESILEHCEPVILNRAIEVLSGM